MRDIACRTRRITTTAMAGVRIRIHTCTAAKRGITCIVTRFTAPTRFAACRGTIGRGGTRCSTIPGIVRTRIVFIVFTLMIPCRTHMIHTATARAAIRTLNTSSPAVIAACIVSVVFTLMFICITNMRHTGTIAQIKTTGTSRHHTFAVRTRYRTRVRYIRFGTLCSTAAAIVRVICKVHTSICTKIWIARTIACLATTCSFITCRSSIGWCGAGHAAAPAVIRTRIVFITITLMVTV